MKPSNRLSWSERKANDAAREKRKSKKLENVGICVIAIFIVYGFIGLALSAHGF